MALAIHLFGHFFCRIYHSPQFAVLQTDGQTDDSMMLIANAVQ